MDVMAVLDWNGSDREVRTASPLVEYKNRGSRITDEDTQFLCAMLCRAEDLPLVFCSASETECGLDGICMPVPFRILRFPVSWFRVHGSVYLSVR